MILNVPLRIKIARSSGCMWTFTWNENFNIMLYGNDTNLKGIWPFTAPPIQSLRMDIVEQEPPLMGACRVSGDDCKPRLGPYKPLDAPDVTCMLATDTLSVNIANTLKNCQINVTIVSFISRPSSRMICLDKSATPL